MNDLGLSLGRLHPVLVHLPIGLLILLGTLELAAALRQKRRWNWLPPLPESQRTFLLFAGVAVSVITAALGWLLSREGSYDVVLLASHRNLGFITAGLTVVLLAAHGIGLRRWYVALLLITLATLGLAGHRGGQITHGSDYLTAYAPAWWRNLFGETARSTAATVRPKPTMATQALAYPDLIAPILAQRCVSCHGPNKSNGDLRLDSWAQLKRGGKNGALIAQAGPSLLLQRLNLPLEAKEHMPPQGKPQLTDDEFTLIEWWIEQGAAEHATLAELSAPPAVNDIANVQLGLVTAAALPDRIATMAVATTLAPKLQIEIRPLSADTPWLAVNARLRGQKFGDAQLAELVPVADAIRWLDLGQTAVTDTGLTTLAQMKHLRRLQLDQTAITDAGLAQLKPLGELEALNLHSTAISDAGLEALKPLARLRSIYLWQTHVTSAAANALGVSLTDERKIQRWNEQIADLQKKIRAEEFSANLGEPLAKPTSAPKPPADPAPVPAK